MVGECLTTGLPERVSTRVCARLFFRCSICERAFNRVCLSVWPDRRHAPVPRPRHAADEQSTLNPCDSISNRQSALGQRRLELGGELEEQPHPSPLASAKVEVQVVPQIAQRLGKAQPDL